MIACDRLIQFFSFKMVNNRQGLFSLILRNTFLQAMFIFLFMHGNISIFSNRTKRVLVLLLKHVKRSLLMKHIERKINKQLREIVSFSLKGKCCKNSNRNEFCQLHDMLKVRWNNPEVKQLQMQPPRGVSNKKCY